jgi:aromatic-L-amino-acid decarboxylase
VSEPELSLDTETFRRLGYRVIDALAERMEGLPEEPVAVAAGRAQMEALLREAPPREGADADAVLDLALSGVLAHGLRVDHPRFFGFVPLPGNPLCALADALASGHAVFVGTAGFSSRASSAR